MNRYEIRERLRAAGPHEVGVLKSGLVAPRWAGFSDAIRDAAQALGLALDISTTKRMLTESGSFRVEGKAPALLQFCDWLEAAQREFNAD